MIIDLASRRVQILGSTPHPEALHAADRPDADDGGGECRERTPGLDLRSVLKPVKQREVMRYLMGRYGVSERRACLTARFWRSSLRYQSRRDPLTALRQRMRELAQTRVRCGIAG